MHRWQLVVRWSHSRDASFRE